MLQQKGFCSISIDDKKTGGVGIAPVLSAVTMMNPAEKL